MSAPNVHTNYFHYGLCDCCAGGGCNFIKSFVFCCHKGIIADARSKQDNSNCCFNSYCVSSVVLRNIIRTNYNIEGSCCGDIMITACCAPCSAVQLSGEVERRGAVCYAIKMK